MTTQSNEKKVRDTDPFVSAFASRRAEGPGWLDAFRQQGINRFATQGFPTLQDEDWRFTNVAAITRLPFKPAPAAALEAIPSGLLPFGGVETDLLVFVDGRFASHLSKVGSVTEGAFVGPLSQALETPGLDLDQSLGNHVTGAENAFAALNAAYFVDGGVVIVPRGKSLERPVQLCFISTGSVAGGASSPRTWIRVGDGASATVVETFVGMGRAAYLTNAVTEAVVGDSGVLEHLRFQDDAAEAFHVGTMHYHLGRASRCWGHSLAMGARLSRVNIRASLAGEGLEAVLNGLYLTRGEQLADHHMVVDHQRPHCASHEYFNGILDERSKGVFHGRILVQQEAQKTDAKQTNKNLLLSDDATVDTKPQLEIYADDVKCTHGATVGQMNEDSIFYLRARGIGLERARRMLMHAFAGEITERIQHEGLREQLDRLVWDRLEQNPHVKAG